MKLALVCALIVAPAFAAPPDSVEQARAVAAIRSYASDYIRNLPDFTCLQVTTRTNWPNMRRRQEAQHAAIEEQITYVNRVETYNVLRINGRPVNGISHDQLLGIWSRGEFGTLLSRTVDARSNAEFRWKRAATVSGHRTWVFAFRVPQPHGYGLVESTRTIVVPYEGLIFADPENGVVYRIELKCDIPADSEYMQLELILDFKPADVSGREFVLPTHFHLHTLKVVRDVSETISDADYKQYRRFAADSSVKYESDEGAAR